MKIDRRSLNLAAAAALALTALGAPQMAAASPDKPVIALSNSYYGNTWRRQMVDAFTAEDGSTHLIVVSDDNHSLIERNLLLEFKLVE